MRDYGISPEDVIEMEEQQGNRCAICGKAFKKGAHYNKNIDHSHTTGKVRGLLCNKCNMMIGLGDDSVSILQRAINYLNKHSKDD